ncbi:peptidoglycan binding protein [Renibacterium salmoninarum ATCC 33209]|uniref:Peptidoglycan binding protein n=1 Tax=Renibacterium salmoninarum (strain ATCC 33209 / DSM 20767 / JCM 11484 / NBRC 15589 / NCIMB 2235) TaxID=288705 RepID=A9WTK2_RENSM|nr:peptidoglycan binding protein [Renibacterium salmoninarum ATCC 33209]
MNQALILETGRTPRLTHQQLAIFKTLLCSPKRVKAIIKPGARF